MKVIRKTCDTLPRRTLRNTPQEFQITKRPRILAGPSIGALKGRRMHGRLRLETQGHTGERD